MKAKPSYRSLETIFNAQIDRLALTLSPGSVKNYRTAARKFLHYLATHHQRMRTVGELRREPHVAGFLRHLATQQPPLSKTTRRLYLIWLRRLFTDIASNPRQAPREDLIVDTDLPRLDRYLPRPLSPEDDGLLQQYLSGRDDLSSYALQLLRRTGMRIGELTHLSTDCLRDLGNSQWALHVPLGKLHTERWTPVDDEVRQLYASILRLRQENPTAISTPFLLPLSGKHCSRRRKLQRALTKATHQAGCSRHITPHQLRHTYASEMIRAGVSLPALMQLLGHKAISMTLRYVQVTQNDLQREYHQARLNMGTLHTIPALLHSYAAAKPRGEIDHILQSLREVRHLIEMYRRQLKDEKYARKIARLANRLVKISIELGRSNTKK